MSAAPLSFAATRRACHVSYIVQAIVNNIAPLLFIVFHTRFSIPVEQLGGLAALNFGVQLLTDLAAMKLVDRVGYRRPMLLAHVMAVLGLALLAVLPTLLPSAFAGLAVAVVVYAIGGGLLEVLVSPIVEHLPSPQEGKATAMALLHSFYCWGQLAVVVVTTVLLGVFGQGLWSLAPLLWAVVPLANLFVLLRVPLPDTVPDEHRTPVRTLLGRPVFLFALVAMMTGGAAELTMSQWSSFFAEQGAGVSKAMGDLLGPGLFALLMGIGRFSYGVWGQRLALEKLLVGSSLGAALCYVIAAWAAVPVVSLLACAGCGLFVSLLWPGTFSLTSARFPLGGGAMFALLALAGDSGGTFGPWLAGILASLTSGPLAWLSDRLPPDGDSGLRAALLLSAAVPLVFGLAVLQMRRDPVGAAVTQ
ncbi:MAG: MFS transporter [Propionicimonas sp.]|uniref:MFS transporter n=1 Tax=Propionicimonas sp. TaxID=1955623 RepID=UPI002B1F6C85|nr:MFS transporter [Propionicimonas sp.]MEA4943578.1 MFS transporter [Propionicimonas sp.]MEA5053810.1 MFS transporter [Propionicimonas sp.]